MEVHDSGPGLSEEAAATLFEPTITFKKAGWDLAVHRQKERAALRRRHHARRGRARRRRLPRRCCRTVRGAGSSDPPKGHDPQHRIVIVDDEPNIGLSLRLILEREGYAVTICESVAEFQPERAPGGRICTCSMCGCPMATASTCCAPIRQNGDPTPVVMISGHGTIRDAVDATRSGAFDFLEKPLGRDRVLLVVKNALERSDLQRENQRFRELVGDAPR